MIDPNFAEDPLQFLSGKKMSDMTEPELREWVDRIRAQRTSSQTFRASLSVGLDTPIGETDTKPKKVSGMDEYAD